ncbi:hypothetical protein RHMOL_Rhmol08G0096300 [Rhododendron molle]|uniref:Uncharacterized protein n=1 Tax=Rhododendron molle TaxID=49168 RepID=A0ACC0MMA7_RHOML|nr:hypothetical protein RHMOL_Rhmol08G0096300 [Rhododendron molle]
MEITSQADGSSPFATVGQIQKCLVVVHCFTLNHQPCQPELSIEDQGRNVVNKRLEDYLDPTLFAAGESKLVGEVDGGADLALGVHWR